MTLQAQSARRRLQLQQEIERLKTKHPQVAELDEGQCWVLYALLQAMAFVKEAPLLRRLCAFLLLHAGMRLRPALLHPLLGVSERALRQYRSLTPQALCESLRRPPHGQRPKLLPAHVGPIARFVIERPAASQADLLRFVRSELRIDIERHTLAAFLARYGLAARAPTAPSPLFAD